MKNLVKELEWFDGSNEDQEGPEARAYGVFSFFIATDETPQSDGTKIKSYYGELFSERKGYCYRAEWSTFRLSSIEAAKAACQAYYEEVILSALTDEALSELKKIANTQTSAE
jgi:hypothetical protein